MKWSLQQLNRYIGTSFEFSDNYNFKEDIKNIYDILDISEVVVKGKCTVLKNDCYTFDLSIKCMLVLECARTLEPVDYPINLDITEVFATEELDEDTRIIEKNTVDLTDVVWETILLEKPIKVVKEDLE